MADLTFLDDDCGGIPTVVRVSRHSPFGQVPLASVPSPPPSDSDGGRFSNNSNSFDDVSGAARCSGDASPTPVAVDAECPSELHNVPQVAGPRRQSARLNHEPMHRVNAAQKLAEIKHHFGLRHILHRVGHMVACVALAFKT